MHLTNTVYFLDRLKMTWMNYMYLSLKYMQFMISYLSGIKY